MTNHLCHSLSQPSPTTTCYLHLVTCCIRHQPMGLALGLLFISLESLCYGFPINDRVCSLSHLFSGKTTIVFTIGLIGVGHGQLLIDFALDVRNKQSCPLPPLLDASQYCCSSRYPTSRAPGT